MTTTPDPEPRVLADLNWCLAQARPDQAGALWSLAESGRQLDANLVCLPADASVALHIEPDLDVLLLVMTGNGRLSTESGDQELTPGTLLWLPRGSSRGLAAGPEGMAYLTTHQARPGMRIRLPKDPEALRLLEEREEESSTQGGEPACMLPRLCPE